MSRVDEALRRAAEDAARNKAAAGLGESEPALVEDAETFAREAFPIEMPDRKRPRPAAERDIVGPHPVRRHEAEPPAPPAPPAPPVAPKPMSAPLADAKPSSLFQRIDARLTEKIVIDEHILPASREQYRRLAAALHDGQRAQGLKVIMIASAVAGEGKTLTASNLALTLSESYRKRVLLIDADLRKPALHTIFRVDNSTGFSDGLLAAQERKLPVRQVSDHLAILPAGAPSDDPMAGLTSDRMRRLVDEAREMFDWIIIDTPPIVLLPDANLLASIADGVVLVLKADSTPHDLVKRAVDAIGRERTLGIVLNRATTPSHMVGYGYGYGYGYGSYGARPRPHVEAAQG